MPDSGNTVGSGAPRSGAFEASAFRRPWHRLLARVLASLNRPLLAPAKCYFGGGTRIVMELDEFRESVDIDFLCSRLTQIGARTVRPTPAIWWISPSWRPAGHANPGTRR